MALTSFLLRAARPASLVDRSLSTCSLKHISAKASCTNFVQQRYTSASRTHLLSRPSQRVFAAAYATDPGVIDVYADVIDDRMPVTVVTGFLGSGKTTLLNNILSQHHGRRIAIIENEFGDIDIDGSLIAHKEVLEGEGGEIVETLNGCACCTVRSDLMDVLQKLVETRSDRYDHIVIETTGMADPRPILSIFTATDMMELLRLDGVVTLVDAKNVGRHLDDTRGLPEAVNEALEQIAYSDRIVLNKIDLVDEAAVDDLERRLRSINSLATTLRTTNAAVPVDYVLGIGGFDLDRVAEEMEPPKAESSHSHTHEHSEGHAHGHDTHAHSHEEHSHGHAEHSHSSEHSHSHEGGAHAEAYHDHSQDHGHHHGHDHVHDDSVTSVSVTVDGEMDLDMVNDWLGSVLYYMSENLYRYKGIMALKDEPRQYVFQGVHEQFIGQSGREWKEGEPRQSRMVFIGRELEHDLLRDGFLKCKEVASQKETAAASA